ncbi:IclR family transcriptional regulator domain-containing protein [Saccharopolyspora erythraea]|uniref:IclR family transcriptional regulator domain-containing protein n=1 Tax=Saccharopolyspora erythraea TaxID=1836 RepID=UPI0024AF5142|nr:IclR family transcriptional regulator C-terminal domain-containing protein [Saccharopolyspora erythraea]
MLKPCHAGLEEATTATNEPGRPDRNSGGRPGTPRVVETGLRPLGPGTITGAGRLREELDTLRGTGIAYEAEESGPGVACAAAPVVHRTGNPIAGLSISTRLGQVDVSSLGPAVRTAAIALGRQAGQMPSLAGSAWAGLR